MSAVITANGPACLRSRIVICPRSVEPVLSKRTVRQASQYLWECLNFDEAWDRWILVSEQYPMFNPIQELQCISIHRNLCLLVKLCDHFAKRGPPKFGSIHQWFESSLMSFGILSSMIPAAIGRGMVENENSMLLVKKPIHEPEIGRELCKEGFQKIPPALTEVRDTWTAPRRTRGRYTHGPSGGRASLGAH